MTGKRLLVGTGVSALLALGPAFALAQGAPEGFGVGEQWSIYHASRWTEAQDTGNPGYSYGYLAPTSFPNYFWVQLDLPIGAAVHEIRWIYFDDTATGRWSFSATGWESGDAPYSPQGRSYGLVAPQASAVPGYDDDLTLTIDPPMPITAWADLNEDGESHWTSQSLWLLAAGEPGDEDHLAFYGAAVRWSRNVSPAPATATFGDVPTTHWAFQFVEALAASGVVGGCGSGDYCPNAPVTRGQMAVYLAASLGMHWPQ